MKVKCITIFFKSSGAYLGFFRYCYKLATPIFAAVYILLNPWTQAAHTAARDCNAQTLIARAFKFNRVPSSFLLSLV